MNRDEVIRLATQAGLIDGPDAVDLGLIETFASLVAAKVKEDCAAVAEIPHMAQSDIARAIRGK